MAAVALTLEGCGPEDVDDILDRVVKPTGGSCMALIPKDYENRKVKVLILKSDKK